MRSTQQMCVFFRRNCCRKMSRHILLLILSLTSVTAIPGEITELTDCFACLEPENIVCKSNSTPSEDVNAFIEEENCLYQFYMDKLQELDCIVMKNLPEPVDDMLWRREVMKIRDQFYNSKEVIEEKICNICTENNTFNNYVKCMKDYWKGMKEKAETEIAVRSKPETPELYESCTILGKKHELFCRTIG